MQTKERILRAALDLFSEKGYEAVSVAELAAELGIKAPSLYKHYASKQEIFDALIAFLTEQYESNSVFAFSHPREEDYAAFAELTPDAAAQKICEQIRLITAHPLIAKMRKLLTVEQYRNPALRDIAEQRFYTDISRYMHGLILFLTEKGTLVQGDAELMALQFLSPVSVQIERIDRLPSCADEAQEIIKRHIIQFFKIYGKE